MHLHRSMQTAILIIVAAGMAVNSENKEKKLVDFAFVVERSPLADPDWKEVVSGYSASIVIHRWVQHWLLCMEWDKRVKEELDAAYMAFSLDITRDKLEEISPYTYSIKEMRDYCDSRVGTRIDTQPHPNRRQQTPAIIKKARDAIRQPYERKGVPVIVIWHVPFAGNMDPHEAIMNLIKTPNGPEAVIAFAAWGPQVDQRMTVKCFGVDCNVPDKFLFKYGKDPNCDQLMPFINKVIDPLWQCLTIITYSSCYFNDWKACLEDSMYEAMYGTFPEYVKYCRSGIKTPGEECGKGVEECFEECKRRMDLSRCSASCGVGEAETVLPAVTGKFRRYCPIGDKVVCRGPPCPITVTRRPVTVTTPPRPVTTRVKTTTPPTTTAPVTRRPATTRMKTTTLPTTTTLVTRRPVTTRRPTALTTTPSTPGDQTPETESPFTRRPVPTRATTTPMVAIPSMPTGIVLQPWMIAVLVVAAVAVLAVMIGVLACCLRKGRKPPAAGAGGHRSRGYTRRSAPGRYDSVARSPSRTHDRQPPRSVGRPRAPSPADRQRPHAHRQPTETYTRPTETYTRPSETYTRPAQAHSRPTYASMPPTRKGGQLPRHRS